MELAILIFSGSLLFFQRSVTELVIHESQIKRKLGFTLYKAEQPLRGMELQEKEAQKD